MISGVDRYIIICREVSVAKFKSSFRFADKARDWLLISRKPFNAQFTNLFATEFDASEIRK